MLFRDYHQDRATTKEGYLSLLPYDILKLVRLYARKYYDWHQIDCFDDLYRYFYSVPSNAKYHRIYFEYKTFYSTQCITKSEDHVVESHIIKESERISFASGLNIFFMIYREGIGYPDIFIVSHQGSVPTNYWPVKFMIKPMMAIKRKMN